MKKIAIIGFGFCGRLAFFHLAKNPENKILIFTKDGLEMPGTAFAPFSPHYILNVPAIKMSAFCDKPKDFCEFIIKNYPQVWNQIGENGFAPRQIYGEYVKKLTDEAFATAKKNGVEVEIVNEEVVAVEENFLIKTKSGNSFAANEIMLATSFTQSNLPFAIHEKNIVEKLWNKNSHSFHEKKFDEEKICLIGSGLTAVDVIVGLNKKNPQFNGKIFITSRRGNFPKKHFLEAQKNPHFISVNDAQAGVVALCLKIRKFLQQNTQFDLRHVIDSIRSITTELWQNFDEKNKKKFLRLLPYWNIFRHRAPADSIDLIESWISAGKIEIKKGGVKKLSEENGEIFIECRDEKFSCDYVVNCLGFEFNAKKYPLLAQMIEADLLKKDLLLAQSNHPQIHLLGGLNIGRDFECTAVPDLRVSVENAVSVD
jgi:uncharacterized NAD(P)/FAD-binding protein YdhS